MEKKRILRRTARFLFPIFAVGVLLSGYLLVKNSIPDVLHTSGQEESAEKLFSSPLIACERSTEASAGGAYRVSCRLFGIVPLKQVKIERTARQWAYACGEPVGIYMETKGVMVVSAGEVVDMEGNRMSPARDIVQPGDYILAMDGQALDSKSQLIALLESSRGEAAELTLRRNRQEIRVRLKPVKARDGSYKLGIWVRDNLQGIGTLTYIQEDKSFGALGHGISDVDTGKLLDLKNGKLYRTRIFSIMKGQNGSPGELMGVIRYTDEDCLGSIGENTDIGIYGSLSENAFAQMERRKAPIAWKQEVEKGEASVLCCVDGQVREYAVRIQSIRLNARDVNKSFVIKVTDPGLLSLTGGIVQGMSGSPVLQKGRLVGAVTHVFIRDAAGGYGIFVEDMLRRTSMPDGGILSK